MSEREEEMPTQPAPQQWLRQDVSAHWIAILNHRREKRGIVLTPWQTRAIRSGDIHEILTTPQVSRFPHEQIDEVYYLGFAVFEAGILAVEDELWDKNGTLLGRIIGFDETHAPNHLNILLASPGRLPGIQAGLLPGMPFVVRKQTHS